MANLVDLSAYSSPFTILVYKFQCNLRLPHPTGTIQNKFPLPAHLNGRFWKPKAALHRLKVVIPAGEHFGRWRWKD